VSAELRIAALIAADHPSLPGHFPSRPIVPGVVMLERVAAAVCAASGAVRIGGIPSLKFLQPLMPDQAFEIVLERLSVRRWKFRCESSGGLLAQGSIDLA
jgi:3-hydroxyacyl-[acyl-carrier-protein] dehydratase